MTSDLGFGSGLTGSISPKFPRAGVKSFFTLRVNGELQINRKWHEQEDAGLGAIQFRDDFITMLRSTGIDLPDTPYPVVPHAVWVPKVEALITVLRSVFGRSPED